MGKRAGKQSVAADTAALTTASAGLSGASQVRDSRGPVVPALPMLWGSTVAKGKLDSARDVTPISKGKQWLATIMSPKEKKRKRGNNVRSMQVMFLFYV